MKLFHTLAWGALMLITHGLAAQIQFSDQAGDLGVAHYYGTGFAGGGVSVVDINGDGWDDLTLATQEGDPIQFYLNNQGVFEQQPALVNNTDQTKQILWVDFDNDGDRDLFVAAFDGVNRLYENDGALNLTDITGQAGLPTVATPTYGACFGDFDRDGFLDLYYGDKTNDFPTNRGYLFRNNRDGTFTDVSVSSFSTDYGKAPFCSAFFELDNDGWPDIYTAHDKTTINTLLHNNGDGTFLDAGESSNAAQVMNAMCVAVGDYDNNGFLDIYVSNTPEGNALLRNEGDNTFSEVALESGTLFEGIGWAANFFDADNDGLLDLYVSAMVISETSKLSVFYHNQGDGTFSQPQIPADSSTVFSHAIGDFNRDGQLDIFTNTADSDALSKIWVNESPNPNHWVKVNLEGVASNRDGVGSMITLHSNGQRIIRYTHCGVGYLGQNSTTETIGVGDATMIDSLEVTWTSGHTDVLYNVDVDIELSIQEGSTKGGHIDIDPDTNMDWFVAVGIPATGSAPVGIHPNPAKENLVISHPGAELGHVSIHTSDGRLLPCPIHREPQRTILEINHLPSGGYIVKMMLDGKWHSSVVVVE